MIQLQVPPSKSVTQRALVLAALASGTSRVLDPLDCDDSRVLRRALEQMGVRVAPTDAGLRVRGAPQLRAPPDPIHLENAGTAVRFTTALALLADGPVTIDGNQAMRRRPMPGLLAALRALGAAVDEQGRPGCPPITVSPPTTTLPEKIVLDASGSSQQLSALLLVAPRLPKGLTITLTGTLPSRPYVDVTLAVMRAFGATVDLAEAGNEPPTFRVAPGGLAGCAYAIEGDHSSASYPLAAGYLTGLPVRVTNARPDSAQGDRVFAELLATLSSPGPCTLNLADTPDIAPTLATCALFADDETHLTGLGHLRIKESDRLAVLARGFRQVGADLQELDDGLIIRPTPLHGDVTLDPAHDHRMAMCFALLGLRLPGLKVSAPDCVTKSYPTFFEMLALFRPPTDRPAAPG